LSKAFTYQQEMALKILVLRRTAKITAFDHKCGRLPKGTSMSALFMGLIKFMTIPELARAVATIISRILKLKYSGG
jgi:hypothetical protein